LAFNCHLSHAHVTCHTSHVTMSLRYVQEQPQGNPSYLDDGHLQFYEEFVQLPLALQCQNISKTFGAQVALESVFFPWSVHS